MNIANHLFVMVKDQPVYTPILFSIPCFKKLYETDTSVDHTEYAKQLVYIWHCHDLKSPFVNSEDRSADAADAAFNNRKYKPTRLVLDCCAEYEKRQSTSETRALITAMKILDDLNSALSKQTQDVELDEKFISDLNAAIGKETKMDKKFDLLTMRDMRIESKNKINKALLDMIPKIGDLVVKIQELRDQVAKNAAEIDSDSNKERITKFMSIELIQKYGGI